MKKADLDAADVKSYRPITNLSVLSKLLERLVAQQLTEYLTENGLLPELQSAYRAHHLTETAMLKVMARGDILLALDSGNLAMLSLLDLSAAFDTVYHDTLLRRLQTSYGFDGIVIKRYISYLSGRVQYVRTPTTTSSRSPVVHGVPQIYGFCRPSSVNCLADRVSACVDEVSSWMRSNRLQVNPSKTEVLWCSSIRRQHQIPTSPVRIGSTYVLPVTSVRDLGLYIDCEVSLQTHVTATSDRASLPYGRYAVFGDVSHGTPCCRSSVR